MPSARIRHALPATSTSALVRRELRRALGHQRVLLADEDAALLADVHDDLAPGPERVRQHAVVADRHRHAARTVAHPEVRDRAVALIARHDLAGELVGLARLGLAQQLARAPSLAGGREARVDERDREQERGAERHHQADRALPGWIHRHRLWRADPSKAPRAARHIKVCSTRPRNFHTATPY